MANEEVDLERTELALKVQKLEHELEKARVPFWKKTGFWIAFIPVVVGVVGLAWTMWQDHLSAQARAEDDRLQEEIEEKSAELADLSIQHDALTVAYAEIDTERQEAAEELQEVTRQLETSRDDLIDIEEQLELLKFEAVCTLGENLFENIAWLGTGLLYLAEDMTYPAGVAHFTEERYPKLFQELGGNAFERRMEGGYCDIYWRDIPHVEALPAVAFATGLVVQFVEKYLSDMIGVDFIGTMTGASPRPKPLTIYDVLDYASSKLGESGPAGEELARKIRDFGTDASLQSESLLLYVDPANVDLSFAQSNSLVWTDVTLSESETRILAAEIERLIDARSHAAYFVRDLAESVQTGCERY
ncbi:MAG: hypothetical protein HWE39_23735 [Oceanospirillaceae bacterium]|uniref:hypothetical protein n=1 Tax=Salipiger sp. HF18 TaxID=2721557 RepID=UPI00142D3051|nr:hypothetical protein [Salipiger sp. HF18]NIY96797.1 hypothetical protein [Salipiger sp. HF18]NVK44261.1 hypothetical protein [Oceanospirillaceae bacterium]